MAERYTAKDAKRAFARLAKALRVEHQTDGSPLWRPTTGNATRMFDAMVGSWHLDYNPTYGGVVVCEMYNEAGAESHPLGDRRMTPREFVHAVDFALRVLEYEKGSPNRLENRV